MTALATLMKRARADTLMPNCYIPAAENGKIIQYEAREGPCRVALVNGHTGFPWRGQMIQSVRAWADRPENQEMIGELRVVSTGPDVATQIAAVDNIINAGYDAIALVAVNPTAFEEVVRRAKRAATELVTFDNPVDTDSILRITPNRVDFGTFKAPSVLERMPEESGWILEIRGIQGNSTDRDRHVGVEHVLTDDPEIEVVEVVGNWDTDTVQRVTADAFAVHGQFDGAICQHVCRGVTNAMAAGTQYLRDEPDTFETMTGYASRVTEMVFTPDELRAQSYENAS